jgi:hypothetical protein
MCSSRWVDFDTSMPACRVRWSAPGAMPQRRPAGGATIERAPCCAMPAACAPTTPTTPALVPESWACARSPLPRSMIREVPARPKMSGRLPRHCTCPGHRLNKRAQGLHSRLQRSARSRHGLWQRAQGLQSWRLHSRARRRSPSRSLPGNGPLAEGLPWGLLQQVPFGLCSRAQRSWLPYRSRSMPAACPLLGCQPRGPWMLATRRAHQRRCSSSQLHVYKTACHVTLGLCYVSVTCPSL